MRRRYTVSQLHTFLRELYKYKDFKIVNSNKQLPNTEIIHPYELLVKAYDMNLINVIRKKNRLYVKAIMIDPPSLDLAERLKHHKSNYKNFNHIASMTPENEIVSEVKLNVPNITSHLHKEIILVSSEQYSISLSLDYSNGECHISPFGKHRDDFYFKSLNPDYTKWKNVATAILHAIFLAEKMKKFNNENPF